MFEHQYKASDFPREILALFDRYVHGQIDRRGFLDGAGKFVVGGLTAAAILDILSPKYVEAQQVPKDDARLRTDYVTYQSPKGYGAIKGYLARPAKAAGKLPGVVVVHENRGLNPHIEDVARRAALEGFLALAPDALTPLGGYPGTDEKGVEMQRTLETPKIMEDFVAAAGFLKTHAESTGRIGAVGFCFGGGVVGQLAVRIPDFGAGVPFYGGQPAAASASTPGGRRSRRRSRPAACATPCTSIRARSTGSTTTRRPGSTRRRPRSRGSARSTSSRRTSCEFGHLVIWSSGHLVIWLFGYLVIVRLFGGPHEPAAHREERQARHAAGQPLLACRLWRVGACAHALLVPALVRRNPACQKREAF
jgi:carboxymethylenebutenolidase